MPLIFNPADTSYICELYTNGVLICDIADIIKTKKNLTLSISRISNTIRDIIRSDFGFDKLPKYFRGFDFDKKVIELFNQEKSVLSIATVLNVSRTEIVSTLKRNNLAIRNGSEANIIRFKNSSPEYIKYITQKAHDAVKGRKHSINERSKMAKTWQNKLTHAGKFENEIYTLLVAKNIKTVPQFAISKYNIDILVRNTFAVEIGSSYDNRIGKTHQFNRNPARTKYINNLGYSFIYVIVAGNASTSDNFNKIVADIDIISSNPTSLCQNWVIRCGFEDVTSFRNELGQFTSVPPSSRTLYTVTKLD
jgi:hypothetical protein